MAAATLQTHKRERSAECADSGREESATARAETTTGNFGTKPHRFAPKDLQPKLLHGSPT